MTIEKRTNPLSSAPHSEGSAASSRKADCRTQTIQRLNVEFRRGGSANGRVYLTRCVETLGTVAVAEVMRAIATFTDLTRDNDPHNEHDFGVIESHGETLFFKIDYYDLTLSRHSPNPADPAITERVLTVMLASEY